MANIDHVIRTAQGHAGAGRFAQAKSVLMRALAGQPTQADLNNAMANVLLYAGELERGAYYARCAVAAAPDRGMLHATLGNALAATRDASGAEAAYRRAIGLDPGNAPAFLGLTNVLEAQTRHEEALEVVRAGMAAAPDDPAMAATCSGVLVNAGRAGEAVELGRRSLGRFAGKPAAMLLPCQAQCFALNYVEAAPEEVLAEHVRYGELLAGMIGGKAPLSGRRGGHLVPLKRGEEGKGTPHRFSQSLEPPLPAEAGRGGGQEREPKTPLTDPRKASDHLSPLRAGRGWGERVRVGFMSPDFRAHSVAYFAEPIIEYLDRAGFEVFCYSTGERSDATTERIKAKADHWREGARLDDAALAARIAQDGIDLLVELSGHTLGHRLGVMARKPAPVQATAIGYPNTTGVGAIDWRVVDAMTDPPGAERLAVEKLARVAGCFLCYRPAEDAPEPGPLPALGTGHITFGSFNALPKISPACVEMWVRAVLAVPGSRLILKNKQLADARSRERWLGVFERAGLEPGRLEVVAYTATAAEHLGVYNRVDIAMDTYPYHGTTTTCEAMWMGVPTVSLCGRVHAARVGASLMGAVGLGELVAQTPGEFVEVAARLAGDVPRLAGMRAGLRERMRGSVLCDGAGYARRMGEVYEGMVRGPHAASQD